jgi:murein DD-endopeptidase MepM/ murein hydrolase activator NlpD
MGNRKVKELPADRTNFIQLSRRNMYWPVLGFAILTLFSFSFFTGCQNSQPTQIATEVSGVLIIPEIMTTSTAVNKESEIKLPEKTIEPTLRITTPLPTKGEPAPKVEICSPLAEHNLRDLSAIVSSPYDPPRMGKDDRHQGVDFAYYVQGTRGSIEGEGVQSMLPGWVAVVIENRLPYGNMIIIETLPSELSEEILRGLNMDPDESIYHLYAHFKGTPLPSLGSRVDCGQLIGNVGKSGYNVPISHLHLETRIGPSGTRFDGMVFYDTQASENEMENYKIWRMSGLFRHFDPLLLLTFAEGDGEFWTLDK